MPTSNHPHPSLMACAPQLPMVGAGNKAPDDASHILMAGLCDLLVLDPAAGEDPKIPNIIQPELRLRAYCGLDAEEVCAIDVVEPEGGPLVRRFGGDFDVRHFNVADVAQEKAARRQLAIVAWLGVAVRLLGRKQGRHLL